MNAHPAIALVHELRKRGVELSAATERDRVVFRPAHAVAPEEVELLRQHRGIVLALLHEESCTQSPPDRTAETDKSLDPALLTVLSVFPGARLVGDAEPWATKIALVFAVTPVECRACGGARFWRLRAGGPWTCALCHPPLPSPERIEWSGTPHVSEVRYVAADDEHRSSGLLGWCSFVIDGGLKVEGVGVRRTTQGQLALAFPHRLDAYGRRWRYLRPITDQMRRSLEDQVLVQIDMGGPVQ